MNVHRIAGAAGIVFGLLTVASGARALFGGADMGTVVPFVLWFNFCAGFAYIVGGFLLLTSHRRALPVALAILIATVGVFVAFGARVLSGDAYEMRTLGAMTLRTVFWCGMVWAATRIHRGTGQS